MGLARAVYNQADVYLLDDPLSAVDAYTGEHIMKEVILGMLKGKTILLPCHALSPLAHADWIVCLEQGRIVEQGTFRGLLEAGGDFTDLMNEHASVTAIAEPEAAAKPEPESINGSVGGPGDEGLKGVDMSPLASKAEKDGKLTEVEERARGNVKSSVFRYYLAQVGVDDREVADNFVGVARNLLDLVTSFAIIVVVLPLFSLWILPMLYLYYRVQRSYRNTAREVKRLSSTSRSPIFQHFNETINGLITMRAFSATERFQDKACANVDVFTRTIMCQATIGRWLSIRLQSLGAITLFFTSLNLTLFPDLIDAGLAGLAINYSNMATGCLQMFISSFTELELKMNGIERVKYYTELKTERPYEHDPAAPLSDPSHQIITAPPTWPARGVVSFKGVSTRYRPGLDLVLDDVSFEVAAGQKIGVCGRTGSGKSSLMLTLFRVLGE